MVRRVSWSIAVLLVLGGCLQPGYYTLDLQVSGSGTTSPAAGTHSYSPGASVQVTAVPESGWTFVGWSGAATGMVNPMTLVMDASKALTATFAQAGATYTLGIDGHCDASRRRELHRLERRRDRSGQSRGHHHGRE
jgi:uncharacterized repeat protein (TIGR02543 family)